MDIRLFQTGFNEFILALGIYVTIYTDTSYLRKIVSQQFRRNDIKAKGR